MNRWFFVTFLFFLCVWNCSAQKPFIPSAVIGAVTFAVSAVGVYIGRKFGSKWEKKAEIAGGVILVLIGIKFLLDGIK